MLLGGSMAVENSNVGRVEELAQSWQDEIEGRVKGLQTGSYARILKMAKKPSKQEFRQTVIVCGIGMFVLGAIGFLILALMVNVFPSFFGWLTG
ncbi:MAG: protein translocase SEC61 complex subunit gamma [Euryarchaeota archaeon]|jgi:protein transport protein SEC61 subunit gamma-like protein|nr:protein translocase SEC61 complex subunit gamma [Euryarchaeota archaeon]MBN55818.1 protein translocase SEC61 complex subunit gamma [Euryarchaeota archaeon]|tara:strand:- start:459 stop:740 length:282 start_codon:yes stop_codon:yes gene_type:complete